MFFNLFRKKTNTRLAQEPEEGNSVQEEPKYGELSELTQESPRKFLKIKFSQLSALLRLCHRVYDSAISIKKRSQEEGNGQAESHGLGDQCVPVEDSNKSIEPEVCRKSNLIEAIKAKVTAGKISDQKTEKVSGDPRCVPVDKSSIKKRTFSSLVAPFTIQLSLLTLGGVFLFVAVGHIPWTLFRAYCFITGNEAWVFAFNSWQPVLHFSGLGLGLLSSLIFVGKNLPKLSTRRLFTNQEVVFNLNELSLASESISPLSDETLCQSSGPNEEPEMNPSSRGLPNDFGQIRESFDRFKPLSLFGSLGLDFTLGLLLVVLTNYGAHISPVVGTTAAVNSVTSPIGGLATTLFSLFIVLKACFEIVPSALKRKSSLAKSKN